MERMNDTRPEEEWLFSHPMYGGHSTPVPILIQQDLEVLTKARRGKATKQHKYKDANRMKEYGCD